MLQLTVKEFDQCYYYSGWSECIIETPSVFGRYVFLSLSTYFILISLPPFPSLNPPLSYCITAPMQYMQLTLILCVQHRALSTSVHIKVQMHQYTAGAHESWRNIHKKTYAAMHRNPSHQHDNLLRWYRLSKDEAPSCDLAGIYS